MVEKINQVESDHIFSEPAIEEFIHTNKERIGIMATLDKEEFNNLNAGMSLEDILLENEILKKFG